MSVITISACIATIKEFELTDHCCGHQKTVLRIRITHYELDDTLATDGSDMKSHYFATKYGFGLTSLLK